MTNDLQDCYRVLELEPGSPVEAVKSSYRDLAKVWHPDRFADNPKLQHRAEEKLKEINLAYERLCEEQEQRPSRRCHSPQSSTPAAGQAPNANAPRHDPGPQHRDFRPKYPRPYESVVFINRGRRIFQVAATLVSFLVLELIFYSGDPHSTPSDSPTTVQPRQPSGRWTYADIMTMYEMAKSRESAFTQMSLSQFSQYMNQKSDSQRFDAGITTGFGALVNQTEAGFTENIERLSSWTGAVGGKVGAVFGTASEAFGRGVGKSLPRGISMLLPLIAAITVLYQFSVRRQRQS